MRAILFVNGDIPDYNKVKQFILPTDYLVAVDGGSRHLQNLTLTPNIIIGDLDSLDIEQREQYEKAGVPIHKYPVHKDETDLEIALEHTILQGYSTIRILAATGGRLDHTLGNIALISHEAYQNLDIRLEDGVQEIFFIHSSQKIRGKPGDILSLLPYGMPAVGVFTQKLKYPLKNETLFPEKTRGISNVFLENEASVSVQSGKLLCIHKRIEP